MDETPAVIETKMYHLDPLPWRACCSDGEKVFSRQPSAVCSSRVHLSCRELYHLRLISLGEQPTFSE